jgi:hypothetical protein
MAFSLELNRFVYSVTILILGLDPRQAEPQLGNGVSPERPVPRALSD